MRSSDSHAWKSKPAADRPTIPAKGVGRKDALELAEAKPPSLSVNETGIPPELRAVAHWVAWRYERRQNEKTGQWKWTKVPVNPRTGRNASPTDYLTWGTFAEALDCYRQRRLDGIGYVFSTADDSRDPFGGVDFDDCVDPQTRTIDPWAACRAAKLDTYTEFSPSVTGVKAFLRARKPPGRCRKGLVEIYDTGRFFAVTGARVDAYPATVNDRQTELERLHAEVFSGETGSNGETHAENRNGPGRGADPTDQELLEKAFAAKNGDKFRRLWDGDTAGYPSQSEADLALCGQLAFWCEGDAQRVDGLFRQSKLMRPKWDERRGQQTYGQRTIATVLAGKTEFYKPSKPGPKIKCSSLEDKDKEQPKDLMGDAIILAYLREKYQPVFRRGPVLYSSALGREVKMGEACSGPTQALVDRLMKARDTPRTKQGDSDRQGIPYFFRNWAQTGWTTLLESLPEEENADELVESAKDEFWAQVAAGFFGMQTLQYISKKGAGNADQELREQQRRSLLSWCQLWAKPGKWEPVRSFLAWIRKGDDGELCIALRVDIFRSQVQNCAGLAKLSENKFSRLAEMYGVGTREKNVKGKRAVKLTPEFIDYLLGRPENPPPSDNPPPRPGGEKTNSQETHAPACEKALENAPKGASCEMPST